jgi:protein CpxP
MSKIKFLSFLAIGLLISNIALIVFMVVHSPSHPKHRGPRNIIIEKLGFDESQVKAYDELIKWHQDEITKTEKDILVLKNRLYSNLAGETESAANDSIINDIGKVQLKIENIHYKHFQDLNKLCNADQKHAYKNLTREIATLFYHPIKGK